MKIDDNIILEEREILLDCLCSEQQLLQKYAETISQTNIKNVALELGNFLIDEQGMCYDFIAQIEKLGNRENGSDKNEDVHSDDL